MSKITKSIEDFNSAKSNADYDHALDKMLWDSFFLQISTASSNGKRLPRRVGREGKNSA